MQLYYCAEAHLKYYLFVVFIINLLIIETTSRHKNFAKLDNNQKEAFPNTFESPVANKDVGENKFKVPVLSRFLYETNPLKGIRKEEFIKTIKYVEYHLTLGELEQIFVFADVNHNDIIEQREWDKFVTLYIQPFEACNGYTNEDSDFPTYLLTEEQFKSCLDSDPKSKFIKFRRRDEEKNKYKLIMSTIASREGDKINFYEYLFIRRVLFAWMKCQSHIKFMAESHFKCAIKLSVPNKIIMKISLRNIYNTGLKYQYKDSSLIQLDFISFLRISHYVSVFTNFNIPNDMADLERSEFLKAVKEDRLPQNFEETDVDLIYQLTNTNHLSPKSGIDFETFCFFYHLHRLFNKYSADRPTLLNLSEFNELLDDPLTPVKIVLGIDQSLTRFLESEYLEASLVLQRLRTNERNFFYSFKQDASLSTKHSSLESTKFGSYYDTENKNEESREVFFSMFTEEKRTHWTKRSLYRAFQLANLFLEVSEITAKEFSQNKRHFNGYLSTSLIHKYLPKAYETATPQISTNQRRNIVLYKIFPKGIGLDMLTFLAVENFPYKLLDEKGEYTETIDETALKHLLKDFGMEKIPDTVLDITRKGYDALRRRIFYSKKSAENALIVHAVSSEHKRKLGNIKDNNIRENKEVSRKYPQKKRRFRSSPLAK